MYRLLIIFLLGVELSQAQSINRSDEHLLFKEAKSSQAVLVLSDSLLFKGKSLRQLPFLHTSYPSLLRDYISFTLKNKTYLVHNGCGVVLEWRNDSLVRIDKSFLHKNQFGAVTFGYQNNYFFWGGYGLFTFKNILTQFDFITKEWTEVETFGKSPSPRIDAHGFILADNLYVFSGFEKDPDHFLQIKACEPVVWKLHLPTMQWSELGKFDFKINLNSKESNVSSFVIGNKFYIIPSKQYDTVIEIDVKNNILTTFKAQIKNVIQPYFDSKTQEVVYVNQKSDGFKSVMRTTLSEFLGKRIDQQKFILPWYQSIAISTIVLAAFSLLFLIGLLRYLQQKKKKFIPFTGIVYFATKEAFYFRGKLLDSFDDAELRILDYFVQHKNRYISLNELNHLFENEIQKESFPTLVKRREVALASLLAKLSFITSIEEQSILDYRRSANDKRVKEIKLKESFIKVK